MQNINKKRIQIIEDDEEMRSLLKDFLREEGYEAEAVSNGSETLRKLDKTLYDLIITDIRMPGLTGLDILPALREMQPQASIIVITAFGSEETQQKALKRGANAYLEKPLCFNHLGQMIQELISTKRREDRKS